MCPLLIGHKDLGDFLILEASMVGHIQGQSAGDWSCSRETEAVPVEGL